MRDLGGQHRMRALSETFMSDFLHGRLVSLLNRVRGDTTLDLQIRENRINVYYRGGSLLSASLERDGRYLFVFDDRYLDFPGAPVWSLPPSSVVGAAEDCDRWMSNIPNIKDVMDRWFAAHPRREREVQQILTRENTWDAMISAGTDYFICDIEYARNGGRADLVAVHWPSDGTARKRRTGHRLAFAELKYGDGALGGESGLVEHVRQADELAANSQTVADLKREMVGLFAQKHKLGLVECKHVLEAFSDERPEMLLVIANHDPESTVLTRELTRIAANPPTHVDVLIGKASDFGYGLYEHNFVDLASYMQRSQA